MCTHVRAFDSGDAGLNGAHAIFILHSIYCAWRVFTHKYRCFGVWQSCQYCIDSGRESRRASQYRPVARHPSGVIKCRVMIDEPLLVVCCFKVTGPAPKAGFWIRNWPKKEKKKEKKGRRNRKRKKKKETGGELKRGKRNEREEVNRLSSNVQTN